MAFSMEAVIASEFIVLSLRIQLEHKWNESESEHARVEQLLRLEEEQIQSMEALEHEQRLRNAFVDRHRKRNEVRFGKGKVVLLFQS
jgi:Spy/CpxP family protein refolding chaperone